jgi:CheY-like chemotaxis protein
MTKPTKHFLLIDDDPQNNMISAMVIRNSLQDTEVQVTDFINPEVGLKYIGTTYINEISKEKTILFLDINMPILSGWEFLEKFRTLEESIKNQFNIYILSSSIDPGDIQRAKLNPLVIDFIEKPLNKTTLVELFV